MFGLGSSELIIIAIIVFLLFGAKRLPEVGKGLGQAIKEFKKVKREVSDESLQLKDQNPNPSAPQKEDQTKANQ